MRIGVDATCWANARGYGRFVREILPAMVTLAPADEFLCFLDRRAADRFSLDAPNVTPIVVNQSVSPTEAAAADSNRSPLDMLRLTRAVGRARPDVFFSPSVYTYFPLPPRIPAVVTIMDAIAERFPEYTLPTRRARLFWRAKVWLALRQSRLVLTISDYAAKEIADVHRLASARIRVATLAPAAVYREVTDAEAVAAAARAAGVPPGARWFLYVGGFSPHKHVEALVRAHARTARAHPEPPHLVLVGARSGDGFLGAQDAIAQAIADCATGSLVHWTGFLPDATMRDLMAGALATALPSASEGFGLPPVEGAATGTPTIATSASPLPQLLAGGGIFVPPGDEDALVAAMAQMLADERGRRAMGAVARTRASALTWQAAAGRALDAIREAAR
jgi:glycosyltransferase involved in cell wall biosynthesis